MIATLRRSDSPQERPSQRVLLNGISWEKFEILLKTIEGDNGARLAYDNGQLEIMNPSPEHEHYKEVIGDAVKDIADELAIDYESYGSTTWRKQAVMAGVEPDNCFYFQNEKVVRGRTDIDIAGGDPPPDLALEIDLTSKSLNRFPIYARLGVPEIWCYDNGALRIYHLKDGSYTESATSLALPNLPIQAIPQLIDANRAAGRRAIRQAIRAWVADYSL